MNVGIVILILLAVIAIGFLVWTSVRISRLHSQLASYSDYITSVRQASRQEVLSEEFMEELRNHARLELDNVLQTVNKELQKNLEAAYQDLIEGLQETTERAMREELKEYEKALKVAKETALKIVEESQTALDAARQEVQEEAQALAEEEKAKLVRRFENQMEDIVSEFLLEVLGSHVDLGAQRTYIFEKLEENKEEIIKDIRDEA